MPEAFTALEGLFSEVGITPNWFYALAHGHTRLYNDNQLILNYYVLDGMCIVNSGSVGDAAFPKSMLRDIKELIGTYENMIISSSVLSIEPYLNKYGFRYNSENRTYIRGVR